MCGCPGGPWRAHMGSHKLHVMISVQGAVVHGPRRAGVSALTREIAGLSPGAMFTASPMACRPSTYGAMRNQLPGQNSRSSPGSFRSLVLA